MSAKSAKVVALDRNTVEAALTVWRFGYRLVAVRGEFEFQVNGLTSLKMLRRSLCESLTFGLGNGRPVTSLKLNNDPAAYVAANLQMLSPSECFKLKQAVDTFIDRKLGLCK